jgi:arabinose-5-phosphate isomerase
MSTHADSTGETGPVVFGAGVIEAERDALAAIATKLRAAATPEAAAFARAVAAVIACKGHVAVTGVGKAGLVGHKLSATLSSTGTPSFALHPSEAAHGDLGMLRQGDLVIALSNSGESEEVTRLLPIFKRGGNPVIAMTGRDGSTLAKHADIVLSIGHVSEACPLGLAPSVSTTALLALGDALALTVQRERNFGAGDYARFHPAGALGRSLMTVQEAMRSGDAAPTLDENTPTRDVLLAVTRARAGAAAIVDKAGTLVGIFTDGDLRRWIERHDWSLPDQQPVHEVMTRNPKRAVVGQLVQEALRTLESHRIDELPVVDAQGRAVGMLDVQDLLAVRTL